MSFLNLPWVWDHDAMVTSVPCPVHIARWRRGPVTFYRYQIAFNGGTDWTTQWWIYIADNFGFAIRLPWWKSDLQMPCPTEEKK